MTEEAKDNSGSDLVALKAAYTLLAGKLRRLESPTDNLRTI